MGGGIGSLGIPYEPLYEGKAKVLLSGPRPDTVVVRFKDSVTAGDGKKRAELPGKGVLAASVSVYLFQLLGARGIPTHFIEPVDERSFLAWRLEMIPLEVVVRNRAAGSLVRRLGLERGRPLKPPLVEFYYKSDERGDPLLCRRHISLLGLVGEAELSEIEALALEANRALAEHFASRGLALVDIKFEVGRKDGEILLADEISPDTFRLWDEAGNSLDKDVFREDKGDLLRAYREVAQRLGVEVP